MSIFNDKTGCRTTYQLEFPSLDSGSIHVVGGGAKFLQLLAGEDVDTDKMDLGMPVFTGLGRGHFHNLARTALDDDVAALPQCRTLHGVGG